MRWKPDSKIQNTAAVVKLSASVVKPNGFSHETEAPEIQPDGFPNETVEAAFDDSRFHQRSTTSLPGTYPALGEALPEWDINIKSIPSPGTQVTDYDLALGLATRGFVSWRDRH